MLLLCTRVPYFLSWGAPSAENVSFLQKKTVFFLPKKGTAPRSQHASLVAPTHLPQIYTYRAKDACYNRGAHRFFVLRFLLNLGAQDLSQNPTWEKNKTAIYLMKTPISGLGTQTRIV